MVGRKAKSYDYGPMIRIDLPLIQVSAILPRKERFFTKTYEENFDAVKEDLSKKGYRQIIGIRVDWTYLPRSCPKCGERGGHPIFQRYRRTRSTQRPAITRNNQIRFKLYYNHSKPKYHQCFIGYMTGGYYQLSKKIDSAKMNMSNWVDKNNIEWSEPPKLRKQRKLK